MKCYPLMLPSYAIKRNIMFRSDFCFVLLIFSFCSGCSLIFKLYFEFPAIKLVPAFSFQDQSASMSNFVVTTPSLTAYPAHPTPGYVPAYGTTAMPSGLSHHHLWPATPNSAMSCAGEAVSVLDGSNVLRPSPFGYGKTAMMPTGSSCNGATVKWVSFSDC